MGLVVAAAVILDPHNPIEGLNDSKKLTEKKREKLFIEIQEKALAWAIAEKQLMKKLINSIYCRLHCWPCVVLLKNSAIQPDHVLVDGNKTPKGLSMGCEAVVGGESLHAEISAASILAKVTRDRRCLLLDEKYPQFGFAKHKGYPTKAHFEAIAQHGVIDEHRRSLGPVRKVLRKQIAYKIIKRLTPLRKSI